MAITIKNAIIMLNNKGKNIITNQLTKYSGSYNFFRAKYNITACIKESFMSKLTTPIKLVMK